MKDTGKSCYHPLHLRSPSMSGERWIHEITTF
jgi:hypothetical protein